MAEGFERFVSDEMLHDQTELAWQRLREAMAVWQKLAKEQARRDAEKNRACRQTSTTSP